MVFRLHSVTVHTLQAAQIPQFRQHLSPVNPVKIIRDPQLLHPILSALSSPRVLVPTMGALHEGHLTLIRHARKLAGDDGCVITSLFVNPTQFNQAEDLENYPRTEEADLDKCRTQGVDIVFIPTPNTIYASDHSAIVTENLLAQHLCGATRPGHFDGVCTIVLKLFNLTRADKAVFGKKDYQQLAIIRRMVRDLNIPITIEGVDTVREPSGLALSSRNQRLTPPQKKDAARIRRGLLAAQSAFLQQETSAVALLKIARQEIDSSSENATIDYLQLLDAETLQPIQEVTQPAIIATAVFYDKVRLIDNIELLTP